MSKPVDEILYNKIKYTDFHIMIDCDDVNKEKWNIELIKNYLENFDKDTKTLNNLAKTR